MRWTNFTAANRIQFYSSRPVIFFEPLPLYAKLPLPKTQFRGGSLEAKQYSREVTRDSLLLDTAHDL